MVGDKQLTHTMTLEMSKNISSPNGYMIVHSSAVSWLSKGK